MGCNSCRPFVWGGIGVNGCGCNSCGHCNSCNSCNVCGDNDRDECTSCCG